MPTPEDKNFWTEARDLRLLEWIEQNPVESRILYTKVSHWHNGTRTQNGNLVTKTECCKRAAKAIFSGDTDAVVRRKLICGTLADTIRRQILNWKKKYLAINSSIKEDRPDIKLGVIEVGTKVFQSLRRYYSHFSLWGRLHAQWRTFPYEADKKALRSKGRSKVPQKSARNIVIVVDSDSDSDDDKKADLNGGGDGGPAHPAEGSRHSARVLNRKLRRYSPTAVKTKIETSSAPQRRDGGSDLTDKIRMQTLENENLRMRMMMDEQKGIREERKRLQEALISGLVATNTMASQAAGDDGNNN